MVKIENTVSIPEEITSKQLSKLNNDKIVCQICGFDFGAFHGSKTKLLPVSSMRYGQSPIKR